MKRLKIILCLLFCVFQYGYSQSQDFHRSPFSVNLYIDSNNFYEFEVNEKNFILSDKTLQVYPGERVLLETERNSNIIESILPVELLSNPDKTIEIEFKQVIERNKHEKMMLKISNPFV